MAFIVVVEGLMKKVYLFWQTFALKRSFNAPPIFAPAQKCMSGAYPALHWMRILLLRSFLAVVRFLFPSANWWAGYPENTANGMFGYTVSILASLDCARPGETIRENCPRAPDAKLSGHADCWQASSDHGQWHLIQ